MKDRLLFEVAGSKEHMGACEDRMEGRTGTDANVLSGLVVVVIVNVNIAKLF